MQFDQDLRALVDIDEFADALAPFRDGEQLSITRLAKAPHIYADVDMKILRICTTSHVQTSIHHLIATCDFCFH